MVTIPIRDVTLRILIGNRSFEVPLEISDLHHDLFGIAPLLISQDLELVLCVFLHEDIVLIQHFDGLMDLHDFTGLHILKVHLPLLRFLTERVDLALQVRDLMFQELFQRAHDFLNSSHFLGHSVVSESCMFNRLVLKGVHLIDLVFKG